MKLDDTLLLKEAVNEIRKIPNVKGIVHFGSSTYSEKYNDVDIMVFFDKVIPCLELMPICEKYGKNNFWIEGQDNGELSPGINAFKKCWSNNKNKKVLFGEDPYANAKVDVTKKDVAQYIAFQYKLRYFFDFSYENVLSVCMNAMLAYADKFPQSKQETITVFKDAYPDFAKYLPDNVNLAKITKEDFVKLYNFFEATLTYFMN